MGIFGQSKLKRWVAWILVFVLTSTDLLGITDVLAFGEASRAIELGHDAASSEEDIVINGILYIGTGDTTIEPGIEFDLMEGVSAEADGQEIEIVPVEVISDQGDSIPIIPGNYKIRIPDTKGVTYSVRYAARMRFSAATASDAEENATASNSGFRRAGQGTGARSASLTVGERVRFLSVSGSFIGTHLRTSPAANAVPPADALYVTDIFQGQVGVNGTGLTANVDNPYTEIRLPIEMLDQTPVIGAEAGKIAGLNIPAAPGVVKSVEYIHDGNDIVARVFLEDVTRTTVVTFPYQVRFKSDRKVPDGYEISARVKFFEQDGTQIPVTPADVKFKVKYDEQKITKYMLTNINSRYANDEYSAYGGANSRVGTTLPVNNAINNADAEYIPFMFQMQSTSHTAYSTEQGLKTQRLLEKIELEEVLPTYKNERTGQIVPATFDAAANPGWVVTENDAAGRPTKVKYIVQSISDDPRTGGADRVLKGDLSDTDPSNDPVTIKLKFPGLKVNSKNVTGGYQSYPLTNTVNAKLIPYDDHKWPAEENNPKTATDPMIFRINSFEGGAGLVSKGNSTGEIVVEPGANHLSTATYTLNYSNITNKELEGLTLIDFNPDARLYFKRLVLLNTDGTYPYNHIKKIYGLNASGGVIGTIYDRDVDGALGNAAKKYVDLDSALTNRINSYVQQVKDGTMSSTAVPHETRTYEQIKIVYDDAQSARMKPGDLAIVRVEMGFTNPYELTALPNVSNTNVDPANRLTNNYKAEATRVLIDGTKSPMTSPNTANNRPYLEPFKESLLMTKVAAAHSGNINTNVVYTIEMDFSKLSKLTEFRNPRFIDVLPHGMEFVLASSQLALPSGVGFSANVISDDMNGSGRQAVELKFSDFRVLDYYDQELANKKIQVRLFARVTDRVFRDPAGTNDTSINRAYFLSDSFDPPQRPDIIVTGPNAPGLIPDIYNADGDPTTTTLLGATANTKLNNGEKIVSEKNIRKRGGTWGKGPILTKYGEEFDYSFYISNAFNTNISNLVLYDIFPYSGDQKYINAGGRGSEVRNTLTGPVQVPAGYTVYYSTNPSPIKNPNTAVTSAAMGWTTAIPDPAAVTAVRIEMNTGTTIPKNSFVRFVVPMKAAVPPEGTYYYTQDAINDFAINYNNGATFGVTNSVRNYFLQYIKVKKEWMGGTNRPEITIQLKQDGVNYSSADYPTGQIELNALNNWEAKFENIPFKRANGTEYNYTVEEVGIGTGDLADYEAYVTGTAAGGFTVTNKYKKTDIIIEKKWDDQSNALNLRPTNIRYQLKKTVSGVTTNEGGVRTLTGAATDNVWTETIQDLPAIDALGNPYSYTVEELDQNTGRMLNYQMTGVTVLNNKVTIHNAFAPVSLPVTKVWADNQNASGLRPASIDLQLRRKTATIAEEDFLPVYTMTGGSTDASWSYTFTNLPKYAPDGTEYEYTVKELDTTSGDLINYTSEVQRANSGAVTLTNTLAVISIEAKKIWQGDNAFATTLRPASVVFQLYRKTNATAEEFVEEKTLSAASATPWIQKFENLMRFDSSGREYTYIVKEKDTGVGALKNYAAQAPVWSTDRKNVSITNTFVPRSLKVSKAWDDAAAPASRPASIKVIVKRTAGATDELVSAAGGDAISGSTWEKIYNNLPVYAADGTAYTYTVEENADANLRNYILPGPVSHTLENTTDSAPIQNFALSNAVKEYKLRVNTFWIDSQNGHGVRPNDTAIQLIRTNADGLGAVNVAADGTISSTSSPGTVTGAMTSNDSTPWVAEYTNLLRYAPDGSEYLYKVTQANEPGLMNYMVSYPLQQGSLTEDSSNPTTLAIQNEIVLKKLKVQKLWSGDDTLGSRPNTVEVKLYRKEGASGTASFTNRMISNLGTTAQEFDELLAYSQNGIAYQYEVVETAVGGYTTTYAPANAALTGAAVPMITVTNTYQPMSITLTKVWDPASVGASSLEVRPQAVEVIVKRKTANIPLEFAPVQSGSGLSAEEKATVILNEAASFTKTISGLPSKAPNGEDYTYSIVEKATDTTLRNYTVSYTGQDTTDIKVKNTVAPNSNIKAEIRWVDNTDRDGVRPNQVEVILQRRLSGTSDAFVDVTDTVIGNTTGYNSNPNQTGPWKYEFSNAPKYDPSGQLYEYRLVEKNQNSLNNYPTSLLDGSENRIFTTDPDGTLVITNTIVRYELPFKKVWENGSSPSLQPANLRFKLKRKTSGAFTTVQRGGADLTEQLPKAGLWNASFTDLIRYDAAGNAYIYTIEEDTSNPALANYSRVLSPTQTTLPANPATGLTMTNTLNSYSLHVETTWVDNSNGLNVRPSATNIKLTRTTTGGVIETVEASASSNLNSGTGDVWTSTFNNLPRYSINGEEYTYTVEQIGAGNAGLRNYATTLPVASSALVPGNPPTLKINHRLKTIEKSVIKKWDDGGSTLRPADVEITLLRKIASDPIYTAVPSTTGVTPNPRTFSAADAIAGDANSWKENFTGLLEFDANGNAYSYSAKEIAEPELTNYTVTQSVEAGTGNLILTNKLNLLEIPFRKKWVGDSTADVIGFRPAAVSIKLKRSWTEGVTAHTEDVETKALSSAQVSAMDSAIWESKFTGLPKYHAASGAEYVYTIEEIGAGANPTLTGTGVLRNYTTAYDQGTVTTDTRTVTNTLVTQSLRLMKKWENDAGFLAYRPNSVQFKLSREAGGISTLVDTKTITGASTDDEWELTVNNLPFYSASGQPLTYSVEEVGTGTGILRNYAAQAMDRPAADALRIINRFTTRDLTVNKVWSGNELQHNTRPSTVNVQLIRKKGATGSEEIIDTKAVNASYTFGNLAKFANDGTEYIYSVREVADGIVANYMPSYGAEVGSTIALTNTFNPISKTIKKQWIGDTGAGVSRPTAATVKLTRKAGTGAWEDVPNTTTVLNTGNSWTVSFQNLAKYAPDGTEYTYGAEEILPSPLGLFANYNISYDVDGAGNLLVKNTLKDNKLKLVKEWENEGSYGTSYRPSSISVVLRRTVDGINYENVGTAYTISAPTWELQLADSFPLKDASGLDYTYSIIEQTANELNNYAPSYPSAGVPAGTLKVKNTFKTIDIPVRKIWADQGFSAYRPANVTFKLTQKKGSTTTDTRTLTLSNADVSALDQNVWESSFTTLPKYAADGTEYTYELTEEGSGAGGLANYTASAAILNAGVREITNTFKTASLRVDTIWDDDSNAQNVRPATNIRITRKTPGGTPEVVYATESSDNTAAGGDRYRSDFADLPIYSSSGQPYTYMVEQLGNGTGGLINYDSTYPIPSGTLDSANITVLEVKNKLKLIEKTAQKKWSGDNAVLHLRPEQVEFELYRKAGAGGTDALVETKALRADFADPWKTKFENLLRYDASGTEYIYSIKEKNAGIGVLRNYAVQAPVWSADNTSVEITNTFILRQLKITKIWNDAHAQAARPANVKIIVKQTAGTQVNLISVAAGDSLSGTTWEKQYSNLPIYAADGTPYTYTIEEVVTSDLSNYTTAAPVSTTLESTTAAAPLKAVSLTNILKQYKLRVDTNWLDSSNTRSVRPSDTAIQLVRTNADGSGAVNVSQTGVTTPAATPSPVTVSGTMTSDDTTAWTVEYTNLLRYAPDGTEYIYTVTQANEPGLNNYTTSYPRASGTLIEAADPTTLKIQNEIKLKNLRVNKEWQGNDALGQRPASVEVKLYRKEGAGGVLSYTNAQISNLGTSEQQFNDLLVYSANGIAYLYEVVETPVGGYITTYAPQRADLLAATAPLITVTNSFEPTTITVSKEWVPAVAGGLEQRPGFVEVIVKRKTASIAPEYANIHNIASATAQENATIRLDTGNTWTKTIQNLPKKAANGEEYSYEIVEKVSGALLNYDISYTGQNTSNLKVTNTIVTGSSIHAEIRWVDDTDRDGVRPNDVQVTLERRIGGGAFTPVTTAVIGNTANYNGDTNQTAPWKYTFANAPRFDGSGNPYEYRIVETDHAKLNNYPASLADGTQNRVFSRDPDGTLVITNTIQRYDLPVSKIWNNGANASMQPSTLLFTLKRKTTGAYATVTRGGNNVILNLPIGGQWSGAFEDLIRYDASGAEFTYTIEEDAANAGLRNYSRVISPTEMTLPANPATGIQVTNTFNEYNLRVETTWVDSSNAQNVRPGATNIRITRKVPSGVAEVVQASASANTDSATGDVWTSTFEHLPRYNAGGAEYTYTVEQIGAGSGVLRNYTTTIPLASGTLSTLTPTTLKIRHELNTINREIVKKWVDSSNSNLLRPADVEIKLARKIASDTAFTDVETRTFDAADAAGGDTNLWKEEFNGLLRYNSTGEEFTYTAIEIDEAALSNYTTATTVDAGTGNLTVTNTLNLLEIPIRKKWAGDQTADVIGFRPSTVGIRLKRSWVDGGNTQTEDVTVKNLTAANVNALDPAIWEEKFSNLARFNPNNRAEYTYFVEEIHAGANPGTVGTAELRNYTTSYDQGTQTTDTRIITNTLVTKKLRLKKKWENDGNFLSYRPANVRFNLSREAGGVTTPVDTKTITGANTDTEWELEVSNLPLYSASGQPLTYSITEVGAGTGALKNYNTLAMEVLPNDTLSITNRFVSRNLTVNKAWAGNDIQHNVRPATVNVTLLRKKGAAGTTETIETKSVTGSYTFADLARYADDGTEYIYSVREEADSIVRNYIPSYSAETASGITITNTFVPISKTVKKQWIGDTGAGVTRPSGTQIKLTRRSPSVSTEDVPNTTETLNAGNTWTKTYNNLSRYAPDGSEYIYEAVEILPSPLGLFANYSISYDTDAAGVLLIKNTLRDNKIKLVKEWADEGAFGASYRPSSVQVQLKRTVDGVNFENVGGLQTISAPTWELQLPDSFPLKDAAGLDYTYSIEEQPSNALKNYTASYPSAGVPAGTLKVRNAFTMIELPAVKIWSDSGFTAYRPANVTFKLTQKKGSIQTATKTLVLTAADQDPHNASLWKGSFTNLAKYAEDGTEYTYTIEEVGAGSGVLRNYVMSHQVNGSVTEITNTFASAKLRIKTDWVDSSNAQNVRPLTTNIRITRTSGGAVEEVFASSSSGNQVATGDGWMSEFTGLPIYDAAGNPYTYTVEQIGSGTGGLLNYATQYNVASGVLTANPASPTTLQITNTISLISKTVEKIWEDNSNALGLRPSDVEIVLTRKIASDTAYTAVGGGTGTYGHTDAPVGNTNLWRKTFNGLLQYDAAGNAYSYFASETAESALANYTSQVSVAAGGEITVKNSLNTMAVPFRKKWNGDADALNLALRPANVSIRLNRSWEVGGVTSAEHVTTKTISAANAGALDSTLWESSFTDLPKYNPSTGGEYTYSIEEVDGGTSTLMGSNGLRNYLANYSIDGTTQIVTNTFVPKSLRVQKIWENDGAFLSYRPTSVTYQIKRTVAGVTSNVKTVTLSGTGDIWQQTVNDLAVYDASGNPYTYSIEEIGAGMGALRNYTTSAMQTLADGTLSITNTFVVRKLDVEKIWAGDDVLHTRPANVRMKLMRKKAGTADAPTEVAAQTVSTTHRFTDLAKYVEDGTPYEYTIVEENAGSTPTALGSGALSNYRTSYSNEVNEKITVTNTFVPISKTVKKVWVGDAAAIAQRPNSVEVKLTRRVGTGAAEDVANSTVTLNAANTWTKQYTGLPKFDAAGNEYIYEPVEIIPGIPTFLDNYVVSYSVSASGELIVTNTLAPNKIKVKKIWADEGAYGTTYRPSSITLQLQRKTDFLPIENVGTPVNITGGTWEYEYPDDFPKRAVNGELYTYSVVEIRDGHIANYAESYAPINNNVLEVTNTLKRIEIKAQKIWQDTGFTAYRPANVTFKLTQKLNGTVIHMETKTLSAADADPNNADIWLSAFTDKLEFAPDGTPYVYTVEELNPGTGALQNYAMSSTVNAGQTEITNRFVPRSLRVVTEWNDTANLHQVRPAQIRFTLTRAANGVTETVETNRISTGGAAAGSWEVNYNNLPRYDANGNEYTYSVAEENANQTGSITPLRNYTTTYPAASGNLNDSSTNPTTLRIRNSINTVTKTATKVWAGENGNTALRPAGISVKLVRKIAAETTPHDVETKNLTAGSAPAWQTAFNPHVVYDASGNPYIYEVVETAAVAPGTLENYHAPVVTWNAQRSEATITNTFLTTQVKVIKSWEDTANAELRPSSVKIKLKRKVGAGAYEYVDSAWVDITSAAGWEKIYTGLAKFDANGDAYSYAVEELAQNNIANYTVSYPLQDAAMNASGTAELQVKNTVNVHSINVDTSWVDASNNRNVRPANTAIQLVRIEPDGTRTFIDANGHATGAVPSPRNVSASTDTWSVSYPNLLQKDVNGAQYRYEVIQAGDNRLNNYTTSYPVQSGFTGSTLQIQNTLNLKSLTTQKLWAGDDSLSVRPAGVTVNLYRRSNNLLPWGTPVASQVIGSTAYTFANLLAYDAQGAQYTYHIAEAAVANYTPSYPQGEDAAFAPTDTNLTRNIVNTYNPIDIKIVKIWDEGSRGTALRPASIRFTVRRSSASNPIADAPVTNVPTPSAEVMVTAAQNWEKTVSGLPKYSANGEEYTYSVVEEMTGTLLNYDLLGYESSTAGSITTIKAKNKLQANVVNARVDWVDNDNRDHVRPNSVKVKLQRRSNGGAFTDVLIPDPMNPLSMIPLTADLTDANQYRHRFEDMDKFDGGGHPYEYQIIELDHVNLSNYPMTHPDGNANRVFSREADGTLVITNRIARFPLPVSKIWNDALNTALRPNSIALKLQRRVGMAAFADVHVTGMQSSLTLPGIGGTWSASFMDLVRYDGQGSEYDYRVVEDMTNSSLRNYQEGYSHASVRMPMAAGTQIDVHNDLQLYPIRVNTNWVDNGNSRGVRPSDTHIQLTRTWTQGGVSHTENVGSPVNSSDTTLSGVTVDHWGVQYNNLPRYDRNGNEYTYSVTQQDEGGLRNYTTSYPNRSGSAGSILSIQNDIHVVSKQVSKIWEGDDDQAALRPNISVKLLRSSANEARADIATLSLTAAGTWTASQGDLLLYDAQGSEYTYEVEEQGVGTAGLARYEAPQYGWNADRSAFTVKNVLRTPSLNARIDWIDNQNAMNLRPGSVRVQLQRSIGGGIFTDYGMPTQIGSATGFTHRFTNVPDVDHLGNAIVYRIVELDDPTLNNYPLTHRDGSANRIFHVAGDGTLVITNVYEPIEIKVQKIWADQSNALLTRPDDLHIKLMQNGTDYREATLSGTADIWEHVFTELPKYTANGTPFVYTVQESMQPALRNYAAAYTQNSSTELVITNTLNYIRVDGEKIWDIQGSDGTIPASIRVNLYRRDAPANVYRQLDVSAATALTPNRWSYAFDQLVEFDRNGQPYFYHVSEDVVPQFFTATVVGNTITNLYPKDTEFKIQKIWDHTGAPLSRQPQNATFKLYRDNALYQSITLDRNDAAVHNWKHTFFVTQANLEGHTFRLEEEMIPSYKTTVVQNADGEYVYTNTYEPIPVKYEPQVIKNILGSHVPESLRYSFTLKAIGNAPMPTDAVNGEKTITVPRGVSPFGEITYKYPGSYSYEVTEAVQAIEGFTFDESRYTVRVEVTDNNGILEKQVSYDRQNAEGISSETGIIYNNRYERPEGSIVVGKRVSNEADPSHREFKFLIEFEVPENAAIPEIYDLNESFAYTGDRTGSVKSGEIILLKHMESITISGIPTGMRYKISEVDYQGYIPRMYDAKGVVVRAGSDHQFENIFFIPAIGSGIQKTKGGASPGGKNKPKPEESKPVGLGDDLKNTTEAQSGGDGETGGSDGGSRTDDGGTLSSRENPTLPEYTRSDPASDTKAKQEERKDSPTNITTSVPQKKSDVSSGKTGKNQTRNGHIPKTGDYADIRLWIIALLLSALGFGSFIFLAGKKKNQEEEQEPDKKSESK